MASTRPTSAVALVLVACLLAISPAKPAWAHVTKCEGTLTGAHKNVMVPRGATCTLQGAQVKGHVLVLKDATLQANASRIHGDVHGAHVRQVLLQYETQVGGDLRIKGADRGTTNGFDINVRIGGDAQLVRNQGRIFVDAARVDGNLEVRNNVSRGRLEVEWNLVGGDLVIEDNVALSSMSVLENHVAGDMEVHTSMGPGLKEVVSNTVGQNLRCFDNEPPFIGGPNAAEQAEGQCF